MGTTVYLTEGHGEATLADSFFETLEAEGFAVKKIDLAEREVPETAALLVAYAPAEDFTAEEAGRIRYFLGEGGDALLFTRPGVETAHFDSILLSYGLVRTSAPLQTPDGQRVHTALGEEGISFASAEAIETTEHQEANYAAIPLLATDEEALREDVQASYVVLAQVEESLMATSHGTADVDLGTQAAEAEGKWEMTRLLFGTSPSLFSAEIYHEETGDDLSAANEELLSSYASYLLTDHTTETEPEAAQPAAAKQNASYLSIAFVICLLLLMAVFIARRAKKNDTGKNEE